MIETTLTFFAVLVVYDILKYLLRLALRYNVVRRKERTAIEIESLIYFMKKGDGNNGKT